jgi:dTDP-4-dehydrorhamnose reductase
VRDEVAVVDDQRTAPTYVGHLAAAVRQLLDGPSGLWHLAADGDCTRAEFAEAIFEPGSTAACGASPPPRWDVRRRDRRTPSSAASGTTR